MIYDIVIVGLGGTGSYLATPLSRYLISQNMEFKLTLIDGDKYESGNIDRQDFSTNHIGENKAKYHFIKLQQLFNNKHESFYYIDNYIGEKDLEYIMHEGGYMFICVDNHFFRKIADERILSMENFIIINAGNELMDGNVQIVSVVNGKNITKKSLISRHPELANSNDGDRSLMSCDELSEMEGGGQIVVSNMMAATLMLTYFMKIIKEPVKSYETFFDLNTLAMRSVDVK